VGPFENIHLFQLNHEININNERNIGENEEEKTQHFQDITINERDTPLFKTHSKFFDLLNKIKQKQQTAVRNVELKEDNDDEKEEEREIVWFEQQTLKRREKRGFLIREQRDENMQIPPNDPLYPIQWHLHGNNTEAIVNVNILPVWKQGCPPFHPLSLLSFVFLLCLRFHFF
jgi:hypothetical protein